MSKNNCIVRFKKGGNTLEVLTKPGTMKPYREGKMKIDQVLVAEEIFSNASKVQKAKNADLKKTCGTDNKSECIKMILDHGDFPLTKKELNDMVQGKRNEIVNYIQKYYYDPTKDPVIRHPISRIESVLNDMRIKIDPHEPINQQLKPILKKLPENLPVKPVNLPTDVEEDYSRDGGNGGKGGKNGKNGKGGGGKGGRGGKGRR